MLLRIFLRLAQRFGADDVELDVVPAHLSRPSSVKTSDGVNFMFSNVPPALR